MGMGFESCEVGFGKKMNWEINWYNPFRTLLNAFENLQYTLCYNVVNLTLRYQFFTKVKMVDEEKYLCFIAFSQK